MLITDTIFHYNGFWNCDSQCRIRIYDSAETTIVIASEIDDNDGTSITNVCEYLIKKVGEHFGLNLQKTLWIEHYPPDGFLEENHTYKIVSINIQGAACWTPIAQEKVGELIACKL
ncbi:MAG: hypothetical protein F6K08_10975 [Okeania sp. SIO1H6]|nr:hypothetical protein [Okeania sp. SIO1H6]